MIFIILSLNFIQIPPKMVRKYHYLTTDFRGRSELSTRKIRSHLKSLILQQVIRILYRHGHTNLANK